MKRFSPGRSSPTHGEAFEVENAVEGAAEFFAAHQVGGGFGYGFIAGVDFGGVDERAENRGAQQALAHWRLAGVEGVEERGSVILSLEERLD